MRRRKLTPLRAVREYCIWCMGDQPMEVKLCIDESCYFYQMRFGKDKRIKKSPTVSKIIKERCIDCVGFDKKLVKICDFDGKKEELCPLFPFRKGKMKRDQEFYYPQIP